MPSDPGPDLHLTRRERDVLQALCRPAASPDVFVEPASVRAIASELVVTQAAVKQHLSHLYEKLDIPDTEPRRRLALAREAIRRGLVPLPDAEGQPSAPRTRYVDSGGAKIAWQVFGEGPAELLFVTGWVSNVDLFWQYAQPRAFFTELGTFARVAVFDKPGTGASDPVDAVPPAEERIDQLVRVMDAAGLRRPTVVGISEGGMAACLAAAARPDRVGRLVMLNATASLFDPRAKGEMTEAEHEAWKDLIRRTADHWGEGIDGDVWLAGARDADRVWGVLQRACASPRVAHAYYDSWAEGLTAFDALPVIRQPTLILHRTGDRVVPSKAGRVAAQRIPGARLVELPGAEHLPWMGETSEILAELRAFAETPAPAPPSGRVLAAVLVVAVSALPTEGGASATAVRDGVERFAGYLVEGTPPRGLATFPGPARAVQAARSILEGLSALDVPACAGLHVGEIEPGGDDAAGHAGEVASGITRSAEPGEILVSRTVRDLAVGSGVAFADRGTQRLAGLSEALQLYAVR